MRKDTVKEVIRDFHLESLPQTRPRDLKVPLNTGKIITLVGVRRAGKSYILYETIKDLIRRGIPKERILYINFEDERLEFNPEDLRLILDAYSELYPHSPISECYIFFDEIQNAKGWERFIRRIYDTVTRNIFITGSNSRLLSQDIATSLRGRTISFEVLPLSFKEYLDFQGVETNIYHSRTRARIVGLFQRFLQEGGFPELVQISEKTLKLKVLQEYFDVMLYRDMIERFGFRNVAVLKYFLKRIMESVTTPLSTHKIYNELKSQGYKVGKGLLYEYLEAAEAASLVLTARKYSPSVLKQELSAKKAYVVDNGLINAVTVRFSRDFGKLLENMIFLELRKRGLDRIFFYKNKRECDFLWVTSEGDQGVIQVCYDVSDPLTLRREVEGLRQAGKQAGLSRGYIVTNEEEDKIETEGFTVEMVPAYKFALGGLKVV